MCCLACARPAAAQIASGGDSVLFRSDAAGVRIEPQFLNPPLTIGPFQTSLGLTARSVADSNVFRTAQETTSDVYVEIAPSAQILARFGPHSATFSARSATRRYARLTTENRDVFDLTYRGQFVLSSTSDAQLRAGFSREIEQRGAAGVNLVSTGPPQFEQLQTSAAIGKEFGRLAISAAGAFTRRTYNPLRFRGGAGLDQSFRDTQTFRAGARASYGVTTSAAVFLSGSASQTQSINRAQGPVRDASGYTVLAGIRSETNGLVIGEIGIGWRGQSFRNAQFRDFGGLTYDATVDWYPTRLISLRAQAGQEIVNSGFVNVAGIVRNSLSARVYYDPLRQMRFILSLDRDRDAFREFRFSTSTVTASLTGRYQIGRHVDVSAYGRLQARASSNRSRIEDYNSVAFGVAITGAL